MISKIMAAKEYVATLKQKYHELDFPAYKLKQWYSKTHRIFFDCTEPDREKCAQVVLKNAGYASFTVFFVVKDQNGSHKLMDASFRNLGTETLEHFVTRFHSQLEPMTRLGVQATGLEYLECIGHSYVEL